MVTFLKVLTQIILGQIPSGFYSLCGFHFVFILVVAEEKAGEGENTGRTGEVTSVSQTLQNHFLSLAQPYPNCTQHIQIGTMNVYHGAGPSQPTDHSDCKPVKRRRIIIESDSD